MPGESLADQARIFADQTSDLLNHTVTNGVRITAVTTQAGFRVMGMGVKASDPDAKPIAVAVRGKPLVWLYLIHTFDLDPEGRYLTMLASTMSVYTSEDMTSDELVLGIDYVREPANQYPGCHLHVSGARDDLDRIYRGDGRDSRKLRDLHLPVGGRRFRPSLEDLIEFMITEEMVEPRPGWSDVVKQHRERWEEIQVKAAVRRHQEHAAVALRNEGWSVTPPSQ